MRRSISILIFTSLTLLGNVAMAAKTDILSVGHFAGAYQTHELVKTASSSGMTNKVFKAIDKPATSMALRAALIDASIMSGKSTTMAKFYTKHLVRKNKTTINQLSTPEAFALGWMRARQNPKSLETQKGKNEVERADPLLLLSAAANRMRGEMTIHMTFALVKSQKALNTPKQSVCAPHECVDEVLKYHKKKKHWSLKQDAVCSIVQSIKSQGTAPKLGSKLCGKHNPKDLPIAAHTQGQTKQPTHKRFSHQNNPQGMQGIQGMPHIVVKGVPPHMVRMMIRMQMQAMKRIQSQHRILPQQRLQGHTATGASPKTIELNPQPVDVKKGDGTKKTDADKKTDTKKLHIDSGNQTTGPSVGKEIILP